MHRFQITRRSIIKAGLTMPLLSLPLYGCQGSDKPSSLDLSLSLVDGYLDRTSVFSGETLTVFANSNLDGPSELRVFNMAGQQVYKFSITGQKQSIINSNPVASGYGYLASGQFTVPSYLPSGMYLIESHMWFVVKSPLPKDICVLYSSNTENAYNSNGGGSLYLPKPQDFQTVSFLRPPKIAVFNYYNRAFYVWLSQFEQAEQCGYITDIDMEDSATLQHCRVLMIPGHSEYWTRKARENVDAFVARGGHLMLLSGNTMWWQVRYADDNQTMVCYKNKLKDPINDPLLKTDQWVDPTLQYPIIDSLGVDFRQAGYGLKVGQDKGWNGFKITAPENYIFSGTGLKIGEILRLPSTEVDGTYISGFDGNGYPVIDFTRLNFYKAKLYGFDFVFQYKEAKDPNNKVKEQIATLAAFQKNPTSGVIFAAPTLDWCGVGGFGSKNQKNVTQITHNALYALLNNIDIF